MAAAVNELLQDQAVDHAIDLHRFSNGVIARMVAILRRTEGALTAQLAEQLLALDRDSFTVERLDALLRSVREINASVYREIGTAILPEIRGLSGVEGSYQVAALRAALPAAVQVVFPVAGVAIEQVYAAAVSQPFQGRLLSGWMANLEAARLNLVRNAVRVGYVEGRTTADIVRTLRGTRARGYIDGLLERPRRELATVVQTALSHTAQTARSAFYDANAEVIKALKWTSTLDTRTSPPCIQRDGKLYEPTTHKPIGHKVPWLQGPGRLHFNCRSVSVPVTKSWEELGLATGDAPAATRASMDGQVPADQTYAQWLAKQSAARQDEVLGPTRGRALRDGTPVERFFNDRGELLTLDQLRKRGGL